jgi:hypothetical protein
MREVNIESKHVEQGAVTTIAEYVGLTPYEAIHELRLVGKNLPRRAQSHHRSAPHDQGVGMPEVRFIVGERKMNGELGGVKRPAFSEILSVRLLYQAGIPSRNSSSAQSGPPAGLANSRSLAARYRNSLLCPRGGDELDASTVDHMVSR